MNLKEDLLPKNKSDLDFIKKLSQYDIVDIKEIVPELLEWLQDFNWPVARHIAMYLIKYTNDIDVEIVEILKGNDDVWKYWIISSLILNSEIKPNEKILREIKRIANTPSQTEKEEEVDQIAVAVLKNRY